MYARLADEGFGDLRRAQAEVFRYIPPAGGRVTDIAEAAGVSKQAMAYTIESLIEMGYLTRESDPADRRAQIVRRTERGWEVNRAARRAVLEVQARVDRGPGAGADGACCCELLGELGEHLGVAYLGSISEVSTRG